MSSIFVTTGKEAIEKACTLPFDVIFLDIGLPDITGDEVGRQKGGIEILEISIDPGLDTTETML